MTRINTIDPVDLTNEWLIAEWRELPRIVNELHKHPQRFKLNDIPKVFTLNTGHVKFFRNKLLFLQKRHNSLISELIKRDINFDKSVVVNLDGLSPAITMFGMNDWTPTKSDHKVLIERLDERFDLRKKSYNITCNNIKSVINCSSSYASYKSKHLNKYL